ncbi:MAG: 16S rRNA (cytosine(1402)-N(4))-methyltransferase RsmH [Armatimonadetes bacterium]|nr:16S rRNA (cytosine(1402)-N(4))-methyltransferase RsmH [Armatimonadota bacterium]
MNQTLELLKVNTFKSCIYLDCTVGTGGHTEALLQSAPRSTVIGFDRDADTLEFARGRLGQYEDRLLLVHGDYRNAAMHLENLGIEMVDGCLIDAGMSLWQVDTPERGMSFRYDAPLDMRFDVNQPTTAADLVNTLRADQLAELFYQAGETRWARSIAASIINRRRQQRITTTAQLIALVEATIPARHQLRSRHPVTRVFAALRQAVNEELDAIANGLIAAANITAPSGRIVVLTYSSSEDRIAKTTLRRLASCSEETKKYPREAPVAPVPPSSFTPSLGRNSMSSRPVVTILTRKPIVPGSEEKRNNPRSRSAKLRAAEKM